MIVNMTPHPINVYPKDCPDRIESGSHEPEFIVAPSGQVARIDEGPIGTFFIEAFDIEGTTPAESMTSIAVEYVNYGSVYGLPRVDGHSPPRTFYVVSLPVALAARGRVDLVVPYREVRNLSGSVIGCRSIARPV